MPAERLAQDWEDADPHGKKAEADGDQGWPGSVTRVSATDQSSDAVKQTGEVSEDLWWAPGSAAFVAMAELARRKAASEPEEDTSDGEFDFSDPNLSESEDTDSLSDDADSGYASEDGDFDTESNAPVFSYVFDDAIARAKWLTEDVDHLLGQEDVVGFVRMAELARSKALADREARLAELGITESDSATYDYTMKDFVDYRSLASDKPYTDGRAILFAGSECTYAITELITKRTEHYDGDTVRYEYTIYEVTTSYSLRYEFEKGFSPVTYLRSTRNAAPLDGTLCAGVVPADEEEEEEEEAPSGSNSDPTVKQATEIVQNALEKLKESKAKAPEETIRAILRARRQAKELLNKEINIVFEQMKKEGESWLSMLGTRLMHLRHALELIDKMCSQALVKAGYEAGRQWMLTRNRGLGPSLALNADYIEGFREGVRSVQDNARYKKGFEEGIRQFYGKGTAYANGDPFHDRGQVDGLNWARDMYKQSPSTLQQALQKAYDFASNALDWLWGGSTSGKGSGNRGKDANELPPLQKDSTQMGEKLGKHCEDWGLDPSKAADRQWLSNKIDDIYGNYNEVRQGPWHPTSGGGSDYLFVRQGNDIVLTKADGTFVSIMKDGANKPAFQNAKQILSRGN